MRTAYGCHCDLNEGEQPDNCVLGTRKIKDCRKAIVLHSQGKVREDCDEWKEIINTIKDNK